MTLNPIYQPTFLQKLLGRNYWFWYAITHKYKSLSGRTFTFLVSNIAKAIEYLTIIYVWKLNPKTLSGVITYLALGRIYQRIISANYSGVLADKIHGGGLTNQLMYPKSNFWLNFT